MSAQNVEEVARGCVPDADRVVCGRRRDQRAGRLRLPSKTYTSLASATAMTRPLAPQSTATLGVAGPSFTADGAEPTRRAPCAVPATISPPHDATSATSARRTVRRVLCRFE